MKSRLWTLEGTKGGKTYEWGPPPKGTNYWDAITESENRTVAFIDKAVEAKKPFFIAHHPMLISFFPDPRNPGKVTANKNTLQEALVKFDAFVSKLQAHPEAKGVAENTLIVLMADNGPFS